MKKVRLAGDGVGAALAQKLVERSPVRRLEVKWECV